MTSSILAAVDPTSDEFLYSYQWRQLRMLVLTKRGARCECCGDTPASGAVMNVDHIKPRKHHPELALVENNLQVLCGTCNHGKGNWSTKDWRPMAGYYYVAHSKRKVSHLWDGSDTFCRQFSAGTIRKPGFDRHEEMRPEQRICCQCVQHARRTK